ncbi:MAG: class I SAM-dependent methyltransferase [Amylibacter sp.]|nr:class I SAM-dependent methyltransferase [Amylibacter sp.]
MSQVQEHYNAYPYPARDPKDERKRLITGSPSNPMEIDHHVFGGARDWNVPLRVLVAGGGSGDGLIQIAQVLTDAKRPYEITYIDLSISTRKIAEKRAKIRGLKNITFITGSLLDASEYGAFDYIDCCGVLHHLLEPQAGFDALAKALAPKGGLGFMVYAPYGRSGVYPLQEAFGELTQGMTPQDRLSFGKSVFQRVPQNHEFKRNTLVGDHQDGDAGFYDLLLHSQDIACTVRDVAGLLDAAGLELANFTQPAMYSLDGLLPPDFVRPDQFSRIDEMHLAERLRGNMKTHIGYAMKQGEVVHVDPLDPTAIPHFIGENPKKVEAFIVQRGGLPVAINGQKLGLGMSPQAAKLLGAIDGVSSVGMLQEKSGLDLAAFNTAWAKLSNLLCGYGLMLYSGLNKIKKSSGVPNDIG